MRQTTKRRTILLAAFAVLAMFVAPIFFQNNQVEATSKETLLQKVAAYGMYKCYKDGGYFKELSLDDYNASTTIVQNSSASTIKLPNGYANNTSVLNCQQILSGTSNGDFRGLYSLKSGVPPSNSSSPETKGAFLEGMGYTKKTGGSTTSSTEKCASFFYNYKAISAADDFSMPEELGTGVAEMRICSPAGTDKIGTDNVSVSFIGTGEFTNGSTNYTVPVPVTVQSSSGSLKLKRPGTASSTTITYSSNDSWRDFIHTSVWNYLTTGLKTGSIINSSAIVTYTIDDTRIQDDGDATSSSAEYEYVGYGTAAAKAMVYLMNNGINNATATKFSEEDKASLLQDYLKDFYGISNKGCNLSEDAASAAVNQGYIEGRIYTSEGFQQCYVKATKNADKKVRVYDADGFFTGNTEKTFEEIIGMAGELTGVTTLSSVTASPTPGSDPSGSDPSGSDPSGSEDTETPICTQASGVLSWFFCPVLNFVGTVVGNIYEWIEDSFLAIPADVMQQGGDGTYKGWAQFRNFANVLFAILFAIVILSQVTGIGISNYNIKKMLPRLIMVVVLVNLSFILCQLAVDLSNLVGHGINQLLRGFASDPFTLGASAELTESLVSGTSSDVENALGGFGGGFAAAGALAGVAAILTWKIWLLPLFLALVSALVAVAFFFLILGIRQAGVIIMVVLAPMAIVCYALPNTKSLFDKWWKIFSSLLMVYPICGAMMGGGVFAATIMISNDSGNLLYLIIAALLTVAPFFFVPSVLKSSLNGIANLGNKLSTMGAKAGAGAQKGIAGTSAFKDAEKQLQYSRAQAAMNRRTGNTAIRNGARWIGNKTGLSKVAAGASQAIGKTGVGKAAGALGKGLGKAGKALGNVTGITAARQRSFARNAQLAAQGKIAQSRANNYNYNQALAGEEARQREADINNAEAYYRDAKQSGIDTSDFAATQKEYEDQLDRLIADPEDDKAIANVAALQRILGATDDGAAYMMSSLAEKANEHSGTENGAKALRKAANNIDFNAFKGRNRNYYKTLSDFSNGKFDSARGDKDKVLGLYKDKDGHEFKYVKGYNNTAGGLKYSADNFGNLDDSAYRQILNGVENGEISGDHLQSLMGTINEAMSNENIHLDNNATAHAKKILAAGYARTAASGSGTAGSQSIAHSASAQSINNLTQSIQRGAPAAGTTEKVTTIGQDGKTVETESIMDKEGKITTQGAVDIANNMLTAVRDNSNSFTPEQLTAMKNYVSAVNQRGTMDDGTAINFDTREFDSAQINVHGGKTPAAPAPAAPTPGTVVTPGAVSGTQVVQTTNPNGSTTTQVHGWSGQIIGGGPEVKTDGGIILTGSAADQYRNDKNNGNQGGPQGGQNP